MTHVLSNGKATQQQTKAHNDSLVLSTIFDAGQISRAAVARRTGLSRTSVGEAVAEMLGQGLVEEIGRGRSRRGKSPILLRVNSEARCLIGLDLSGAEFRGLLVNLRGEVRHALSLPRDGRSGAAALEVAYRLIDCLVREADALLLGLGVGTPGVIDRQRGSQVNWAVNLDWLDVPLRDLLASRYGLPVHVLNDSQAAAMGEYFFGDDHETGNLVVIKSDEGLGAGLVLEGRLFHGDRFGAGEIGHVVFGDGGAACACGKAGCLETVASVAGIVRAVRAAAAGDPGSVLHQTAARDLALDIEAVRQAYDAGDAATRRVVREAGRELGVAIAALVGTLNVRDIVLAGHLTRLGEPLLAAVRQEVVGRSLGALARDTRIAFSRIGSDLTPLGAAAVLLHEELGIWPFRRPVAPLDDTLGSEAVLA